MNLVPHLPAHAEETVHAFLRAHVERSGAGGVLVGLSGGIDSALCARLARDALGPERVFGITLPDAGFSDGLESELSEYTRSLGISLTSHRIDLIEQAYRRLLPEIADRTTWGNTKTRIRMTVLYALARTENRLVLGTGNKSEILLGYFTKYGDGGVDLLPIGDLYKSQEAELAQRLDLPLSFRERVPTAGLWEGQTDEAELGLPYSTLDQILFGIEQLRAPEEIARVANQPLSVVEEIQHRVERNRHKRRSPPIPKIGLRTVGVDWRD